MSCSQGAGEAPVVHCENTADNICPRAVLMLASTVNSPHVSNLNLHHDILQTRHQCQRHSIIGWLAGPSLNATIAEKQWGGIDHVA